jgi:hypothetical protein
MSVVQGCVHYFLFEYSIMFPEFMFFLQMNIWAPPSARGKAEGQAAPGSAALRFFTAQRTGAVKEHHQLLQKPSISYRKMTYTSTKLLLCLLQICWRNLSYRIYST